MRKFYNIIILFSVLLLNTGAIAKSTFDTAKGSRKEQKINTNSICFERVVAPSASISGNATVCLNATKPVVTFTGSGGTAPYTFTYKINGGADVSVTTTIGNSVTVDQATSIAGVFNYTLVSVKDKISTPQTVSGSAKITIGAPPVATFTSPNNNNATPICSSTPVQFSANQVQSGSNFSYAWNFGDNTAVSTVNSATTTHIFESFGTGNETFNVDLTVTNKVTGCFATVNNQPIVVRKSPDASLNINSTNGATKFVTSKNLFLNCGATIASPNFLFKAINASTTTNSSYTINWGDSSPTENLASTFTDATHNYTKLGYFDITVTATNATTSCSTPKIYKFFNGNSPIGNLDSPGNANSCVPYSYTWNVDPGTLNNPPGTSYIFAVNDGSTPQTFTQENLPTTITHQFNKTSCGIGLVGNKFTVTFEITNPCDSNPTTTTVSSTQKPIAKYTISPTSTSTSYCVNKTLTFNNESEGYYGTSCETSYNKTWSITPATGWTITSGTLTSENIGIKFTTSGNYDVKLAILEPGGDITNVCTNDEIIKTICIEPALTTPTISLTPSNTSNCIPLTVNASTPNVTSNCTTPIDYLWTVTHTSLDCDVLASDPTYLNSTTSASKNPVFNFTSPGIYSVQLKMTNSCGEVLSSIQKITVKKPPKVTVAPIDDLCGGSAGTTIINPTATIQNCGFTNAELVYNWSFPVETPATSNAVAPQVTYTTGGSKTVSLIISTVGGCDNSAPSTETFDIGTAPTLGALSPATQTICSGSSTTALALSAESTTTFSWSATTIPSDVTVTPLSGNANSIPALTITNASTTSKTVTLTITSTLNGCPSTNKYDIVVNPGPTLTQPVGSTICSGGTLTPLSVVVTPTPAAGTATYKWYSNTTGDTVVTTSTLVKTSTADGSYTLLDAVGPIYYFCEITFSSSGSCPNIKSNAVAITVNTGATINPQPIQNQNICVGATIATPLFSDYTGGTGTASYKWYKNTTDSTIGGTEINGATTSSYTPPVFNDKVIAYYYVTITFTGNGCGPISSDPAEIKVFADPVINSILPATQSLCSGVTPTNLSVTATGEPTLGNLSYQWFSNTTNSNSDGNAIVLSGETNATFTPPTSNAGTLYYYCVVSQNGLGCETTSDTVSVTVNLAATITQQPQLSILCLGETPTLLEVAFTNGVGTPQYQWYSNATNTIAGSQSIPSATNPTFAPPDSTVGTVYYYCKITLPTGGCSELNSDFAEVTINQNPEIANKTDIICSGNAFTISPLNSGSEIVPIGTTYTWSNPVISPSGAITGASNQNVAQTEISQTLVNATTNPATVTYTVTPIVGVCGGTSFTVTITVNPAISNPVTVTNSSCFRKNNGTIQTNITGGIPFSSGTPYLISWTGPNSFAATNPTISNLAPGDYTIKVTDAGGCPFLKTYSITEPAAITITTDVEKDVTCFNDADGKIEITVAGGTLNYTYSWTKDGNPFSAIEDIANLSPGAYSVAVSDANTCGPTTAIFTITEPPILAVNLVSKTDVLCFGDSTGTITINTTGGTPTEVTTGIFDYKYDWTGPNGYTSSNQNLSGIASGTYDLVVTDNSSCTKSLSVLITQSSEIVINATTTTIKCYGDNNATIAVVLSGGNPPYEVSWSNFAKGLFLDNLSGGDYEITVKDSKECIKKLTINIPEPLVFKIDPIVNNISCFGAKDGSIKLNFVGGLAPISFAWADNATAGTDRNNLGPGTYTVDISDGKPCFIAQTFIILEPQELVVTTNIKNAFNCDDANSGSINLLVAGGSTPFSYSWSNGATTEDLINIPAGNYLVKVTDTNGCSKTAQNVINRQAPIVIAVNTKTVADCDARTVKQSFIAAVSGGIPPYKLVWSTGTVSGANNEIMETTINGTVQLTVTDSFGCNANYTFTVDTPELGTVSFNTSSYAFATFGFYSVADPIQFTSMATGDYETIAWNFGDGTASTEENPTHVYAKTGNYIVTETVTYPFGCVYVHTISLLVEKGYVLEVPQAFTPNNDTLNDTMRPVFRGLKKVRMDIYDTWGSLLYSEEGQTLKGWDGKIKGVQAENGNYFCKVQSETFYNLSLETAQPFTLIK